jgi:hypothetical protein
MFAGAVAFLWLVGSFGHDFIIPCLWFLQCVYEFVMIVSENNNVYPADFSKFSTNIQVFSTDFKDIAAGCVQIKAYICILFVLIVKHQKYLWKSHE